MKAVDLISIKFHGVVHGAACGVAARGVDALDAVVHGVIPLADARRRGREEGGALVFPLWGPVGVGVLRSERTHGWAVLSLASLGSSGFC